MGGAGSDLIRGGKGVDTYKLSAGKDSIFGFTIGEDVVQSSTVPEVTQQSNGVLLSYQGGRTLLRGVLLDDAEAWLTLGDGGLEILA